MANLDLKQPLESGTQGTVYVALVATIAMAAGSLLALKKQKPAAAA